MIHSKIQKRTIKPSLLISLFILTTIFAACEENTTPNTYLSESIKGHWVNQVLIDSIYSYERTDSLRNQEYGFSFIADNQFIERKNAGWCGTPPIYYNDFEGTWSKEDSILHMEVAYWGGTAKYTWKLISVDNTSLKIIKIKQEYEMTEYQ